MNKAVVTIYGEPSYDPIGSKSLSSTIQDEGLYGMPVQILEAYRNHWVKIRTHYQYEGYVPTLDLQALSADEKKKREASHLRFVLHPYIDVLSMPKVQGIHLQSLTRGAIIFLVEELPEEGWSKVRLNDGMEGYVKSSFLGPYYDEPASLDELTLRRKLITSALTYLGTQYRWGGKSSLGIDCSGLCSMAYLLNGIKIYRDAKIKEGFPIHEIDFEDKKPGDLIYYKGHMTMYLGDEKYVHATGKAGSDGVVINSLNPRDTNYREDLATQVLAVGSLFT